MRRQEAGFTLLEMLVVIAILGLAGALVLTRGAPRSAGQEATAAAAAVSAALRAARSEAIVTDRPVDFLLDPVRRSYHIGAGLPHPLPPGASVEPQPARIRFTPDGASSGGTIRVASGATAVLVEVDWLTGRVGVARAR